MKRHITTKLCSVVLAVLMVIAMTPLNVIADEAAVPQNAEVKTEQVEKSTDESKAEPKVETKAEPKAEAEAAEEVPSGNDEEATEEANVTTKDSSKESVKEEKETKKDDSEQQEITDQEGTQEVSKKEEKYPAVTLSKTVDGVKVTLSAPEGSLPKGVKLNVSPVKAVQVYKAVERKLLTEGRELSDAVAFDVTPVDKNGNEVQPKKEVNVTFAGTDLDGGKKDEINVYRVAVDASKVEEMPTSTATMDKQTFATNHFTIYVASASQQDPNGDGSNQANSTSHRYELQHGSSVNLQTSHTTSNASYWSVTAGGNYITLTSVTGNARQATITNNNNTNSDQQATVRWQRSGTSEYFYITVKAQAKHTVTFNLQDAGESSFAVDSTQEVNNGGSVTAPTKADKTDGSGRTWTFSGWFTNQACTQAATAADYQNITADKQFYGKYTLKNHTVTFNLQDAGASSFATVDTKHVQSGSSVTPPIEPSDKTDSSGRTWVFSGWFTDQPCTQAATDTDYQNITADKEFYAKYVLKKHKVTFMFQDAGESSFTKETEIEVDSGSDVTGAPTHGDKTESGKTYVFTDWCTDDSCSTKAALTNIKADKTVYGKYVPEVQLRYHANTPDSVTLPIPNPVEAPAGTNVHLGSATRSGYSFVGWNTEDNGTGTSYNAGDDVPLPDTGLELYAQWDAGTITMTYYRNYDSSDTSIVESVSKVDVNKEITLIEDRPTRQNYLFLGWAKNRNATEPEYEPSEVFTTGNENIELYAVWGPYEQNVVLATEKLTATPQKIPYDGQQHTLATRQVTGGTDSVTATIIDINEQDNPTSPTGYKYGGYVRVGNVTGDNRHHIYARITGITVSGTNVGTYSHPYAELFTHIDGTGDFESLNEYMPIEGYTLTIEPAEVKISTESASKPYDGNPLTAAGKAEFKDGTTDKTAVITNAGGAVTLLNGETLNMRITGSQTEVGASQNTYEIAWGDPSDAWGGSFSPSTAHAHNYKIVDGTIGTLEVFRYQVKYDKNAGSAAVGNMPENEDARSASYTLPSTEPTREHFEFKGWNTKADGSGDTYAPGATYNFPDGTKEVTFYAQWKIDEHSVKYDPNGGTFRGSTDVTDLGKFQYGEDIQIAEKATRELYHFVGWNTKQDGTGTDYQPNANFEVEKDVTFYAQWQQTKGKYKFVHYFEQQDGTYAKKYWDGTQFEPCEGHEGAERVSGSQIDVMVDDYDGYTYNDTKSVKSGKVYFDDDGNTLYITDNEGTHIPDPINGGDLKEFRIYFDLNETEVKYAWEGTYPEHPTDLTDREPATTTHKYGEKVYIDTTYKKNETVVDGETFQGWQFHREIPIKTDTGGEYFIVPALASVTLYGHWNMDDGFYKYVHYFEQADGSYAATYWNGTEFVPCEGHKKPASTGDKANIEYEPYTGYEAYPGHPDTLTSGSVEINQEGNVEAILDENDEEIKKDGVNVTEFSLYYKLKRYTVTYNYRGTTVPPNPDKPYDGAVGYENAYYGQTINDVYKLEDKSATYAKNENYAGYIFQGWETKHEGIELDGSKLVMPARNVNLEGTWKPATDTPYTVEYYKQDIDADTYSIDDDATEEKTGTTDTDATYDQKEFDGFTYEKVEFKNAGGKITGDGKQVVKLYYTRNVYAVTFDPKGGKLDGSTDAKTTNYPHGKKIEIADEPTREHYEFTGWKDDDGKTYEPGDEYEVTKNVTFEAQWKRITHEFTYDPNGGKFKNKTEPTSIEYNEGDTVDIEEAPTRDHYKFLGWKLGDTNYQPGDDFEVEKDATFVAQWERITHEFTYDPNGGEFKGKTDATKFVYDEGDTVDIEEAPTREHYNFLGWELNDVNYQPGDKFEVETEVTFVAKWEPIKHEFTYDPNGGKFKGKTDPTAIEYNEGDTVDIEEAPTRDHYKFLGWELKSKKYQPGDKFDVDEDVTFVAQWEVITHKFTYDPNGGEFRGSKDPTAIEYIEGQTVEVAKAATRDGYQFLGWLSGTKLYQPGDDLEVTEDITFTAQWKKEEAKKVKVTYDPRGGNFKGKTEPTSFEYNEGDTVDIEEAPTRNGYKFLGWQSGDKLYQSGDKMVVTGDVTLVATWEEEFCEVILDPNGGSYDGSTQPKVVKYKKGEMMTVPGASTREGHKFLGWQSGDKLYQPGDKIEVTGDITFAAIWEDETCEIIFDPNGGLFEGSTDPKIIRYNKGETIIIPEAPTREGYKFLFWKGSEYQPGDEYLVEGDHTFVAQWQKEETPDDDPIDPVVPKKKTVKPVKKSKGPKTGDNVALTLWILTMLLSAGGMAGAATYRRKKKA